MKKSLILKKVTIRDMDEGELRNVVGATQGVSNCGTCQNSPCGTCAKTCPANPPTKPGG
jgi:hypothetical protein